MNTPTRSRQKSCEQCANSKRQCDRGSPKCSRCTSKDLRCLYKSTPRHHSAETDILAPLPNGQFTGNFQPGSSNTQVPPLDNMFVEQPGFQDVSMPLLPGVRDPYDCELGVMDRSRIRFLIRQMKTYPTLLVQNGKAPFIHPQASHAWPLIPSPLQDAIAASALYLSKNEKNEAIMWDIVSAKVAVLMEARASWSVAEHLTCLQALVIYQIIRLFDGDIRARADAEASENTLVDWTDRLVARTGANISPETAVSNSWENWVFEEAVSRTVIVSRMVQAMFMIVKQGFCTLVEAVTEMSFTAQKALWYAPTAVHW
ncbi:uncharacterized protein K444DRAFT_552904, partial [Hyaloscypha bicolor E]